MKNARCSVSTSDERTTVCLIAKNSDNPRILPLLAVKVSTGKAQEKGIEHYLTGEWKEGWSDWLKEAKKSFPSVLEHAVFTFFIEGCSRVCSHQLVRHRLLSVTQESQRYSETRILKAFERAFGKVLGWDEIIKLLNVGSQDLNEFEERLIIKDLEERGIGCRELSKKLEEVVSELFVVPKSVNKTTAALSMMHSLYSYALCRSSAPMEDCRFLLPQAIRTSMLVTANLREWLHIIELRDNPKAQWEIRGVARAIRELLRGEVPEVF